MNVQEVSESIELAVKECGVQAISKLPAFLQALRMAQGISALRAALTDQLVQQAIMPLQGTKLGFLTDKDKEGGYGLSVVRECSIDAMLRGFSVVGNEFNIIAGGFYGTKAGYHRKVLEFPGLTDLVLSPGVPNLNQDKSGALVPFSASWKLDGKPMSIACQYIKEGETVTDQRIPVRVNGGMGADAILGKAERKILFRIYQRINGGTFGATDGEVGEEPITTTGETVPTPPPVPEGTPDGRRIKMNGKKPAPAAPAAETAPTSATAPAAQQQVSPEDDGRIT